MARRFTAERRNQLAQMIVSEGSVTVAEAARRLNVSGETIRKDMIHLEEEGVINKTHGGALPVNTVSETPMFQKAIENADKKRQIAMKALEYIPEKSTIILDSGSTTLALAELLKMKKNLTIFTNNLQAFIALSGSENEVYVFGGKLRLKSQAIWGSWANEQIMKLKPDIVFLGTDGFAGFDGPTTTALEEYEIKTNYIRAARKCIVLADSNKFSSTSLVQYESWRNIQVLITDDEVPKQELLKLSEKTEVVIA
ncbi:MAG: DeoR/GlpR family DNA-binding transcription regulator [Lachnospiraceae bacterium]